MCRHGAAVLQATLWLKACIHWGYRVHDFPPSDVCLDNKTLHVEVFQPASFRCVFLNQCFPDISLAHCLICNCGIKWCHLIPHKQLCVLTNINTSTPFCFCIALFFLFVLWINTFGQGRLRQKENMESNYFLSLNTLWKLWTPPSRSQGEGRENGLCRSVAFFLFSCCLYLTLAFSSLSCTLFSLLVHNPPAAYFSL